MKNSRLPGGGEVVQVRINPRSLLTLISAAEAVTRLPAGTSLATCVSQGIVVLVETILASGVIPEPDGFRYSEVVGRYKKQPHRMKKLANANIGHLAAANRAADQLEPRLPTQVEQIERAAAHFLHSPPPMVQSSLLGRFKLEYERIKQKMDVIPSNVTEWEKRKYEMLVDVLMGERTLDSLPFSPDGVMREPLDGSPVDSALIALINEAD